MPLGVEHWGFYLKMVKIFFVRLPLMPLGVEHDFGYLQTDLFICAITFDAVRR